MGSHHSLVVTRSDGSTEIRHFALAHYRGSGPRLAVVVEAIPGRDGVFDFDQTEDGDWHYIYDITFVGLAFQAAFQQGLVVESVQAIARSYDQSVAHLGGGRVTLLDMNA